MRLVNCIFIIFIFLLAVVICMVEKKVIKEIKNEISTPSATVIPDVIDVQSASEQFSHTFSTDEQSPRNPNTTKAKEKSSKKFNSKFLVIGAVVLVIVILLAVFFLMPKYKFSYNLGGVSYLSNDYVPSEFFSELRASDEVYVSIDIGTQTRDQMVVNSSNLWIVALNAAHKKAISLVRVIDTNNNFAYCLTNDGNVLVNRRVEVAECSSILSDSSKMKVLISIGKENSAYLSKNELKIFATGSDTISTVNYLVIKEAYSNFDDVLVAVGNMIGGMKN